MYEFKSSEMEVNFKNGVPQSNTNLIIQDQKNTYNGTGGTFQ